MSHQLRLLAQTTVFGTLEISSDLVDGPRILLDSVESDKTALIVLGDYTVSNRGELAVKFTLRTVKMT